MIKIISLFSGIGAFETALENLSIHHQIVGYSEIDPNASKAYSLLHHVPESMNLGDITKLDVCSLPSADLITYGFPCQDISSAGLKKGMFDESGQKTRSGLFFDALRVIKHIKPKVAIAENVKNLTSASMKDTFDLVLHSLSNAGYNNYYTVLNAADYGIPQHRERVFIVSIRKDIDSKNFAFPPASPMTSHMIDYLDHDVPELYFLPEWKTKNAVIFDGSTDRKNAIVQCGDLKHYTNDQMNRIYSPFGLSPTLKTVSGGGGAKSRSMTILKFVM